MAEAGNSRVTRAAKSSQARSVAPANGSLLFQVARGGPGLVVDCGRARCRRVRARSGCLYWDTAEKPTSCVLDPNIVAAITVNTLLFVATTRTAVTATGRRGVVLLCSTTLTRGSFLRVTCPGPTMRARIDEIGRCALFLLVLAPAWLQACVHAHIKPPGPAGAYGGST